MKGHTFTGALCAVLTIWLTSTALAAEQALPEPLETKGFNEVLVQTGNVFIAGQPTPGGLARMQAAGVGTVVNLRTHMEMNNREIVPFDEAIVVRELGMNYVHIPSGGPDTPYSPEMVAELAAALDAAEGNVLLHCTVAWRASHLWVAYLHQYRNLPMGDALAHGRAINLGTLPLEGFLGEPLIISVADE